MKNFLYSLFIGLFGIAALTSIAFLLMYAAQSKQQAHLYSDLAAVRKQDTQQETASEPEKQASYQNLYWENTDMVGWILIEDTNIDYPVMQTPTDPTYYLKHDFEKNYTDYGCPFMQADCDALAPSDNLILYGHNMKDGSMCRQIPPMRSRSIGLWTQQPRKNLPIMCRPAKRGRCTIQAFQLSTATSCSRFPPATTLPITADCL